MSLQKSLRKKIQYTLAKQGFVLSPQLKPKNNSKQGIRSINKFGKLKSLQKHSKFLLENKKLIKEFILDGNQINVDEIKLELKYVKPGSLESKIFFWWNLVWWSIPYVHPVGRQLRFIIWDKTHDSPFGLIGLSSPPLRISVRDEYLAIPKNKMVFWANVSLHGQRVGALPPYNNLLGGKLAAMTLTANEIRDIYSKKYENIITLKGRRKLPSQLFFITTTSIFGKSSMYNRIRYHSERVEKFLGFTKGIGSFYLEEKLYQQILDYLKSQGCETSNVLGAKSSRKIKLIHTAFDKLGIKRGNGDGIKRGFYLFSNINNLKNVIKNNEEPIWHDRPFEKIQNYWLTRYAIPRSERKNDFQQFSSKQIFEKLTRELTN